MGVGWTIDGEQMTPPQWLILRRFLNPYENSKRADKHVFFKAMPISNFSSKHLCHSLCPHPGTAKLSFYDTPEKENKLLDSKPGLICEGLEIEGF